MKGFVAFTKSGSQYKITYNEEDGYARISGGKFGDAQIDIEKPGFVSPGMPLKVTCLDTMNNAVFGINGGNVIQTSAIDHVYQIREQQNDLGMDSIEFER
jgi:hypothetical protein